MSAACTRLDCPTSDIAAYIDGELTPMRELELDAHFAGCGTCTRKLNEQKLFLCSLNSSLKEDGELDLPANFAKLVVASAESSVTGLRRPREQYNALFICSALLLFGLFALGTDSPRFLAAVSTVFEQIGAVVALVAHLIYTIFLGFGIIVRSIASQFRIELGAAVLFPAVVAALILYASRKALHTWRA